MIVVVGSPAVRKHDSEVRAAGSAARVALAAASAGRTVQLVGRTGDDPAGEGLVLALTRGGVGHVALLRDPSGLTLMEAEPEPEPEPGIDDGDPSPAVETDAPSPKPVRRATLDAADVELGLRYLTEFAVVVLAEPAGQDVVKVVTDAARWNGAQLLMVVDPGTSHGEGFPPEAIVFEAPADDRDGAFATLVGMFAAALDDGADPGDAFRASIESEGWSRAAVD